MGESETGRPLPRFSYRFGNLQPNINESAVVETASATITMMMAISCIRLLAISFTTASLLVAISLLSRPPSATLMPIARARLSPCLKRCLNNVPLALKNFEGRARPSALSRTHLDFAFFRYGDFEGRAEICVLK